MTITVLMADLCTVMKAKETEDPLLCLYCSLVPICYSALHPPILFLGATQPSTRTLALFKPLIDTNRHIHHKISVPHILPPIQPSVTHTLSRLFQESQISRRPTHNTIEDVVGQSIESTDSV
ncbi:hypothetical protein PM082_023836 [Marasmius tenuissimus]|nr:hypothetical protein PM082_023836 [Marasmius tenuissimus]